MAAVPKYQNRTAATRLDALAPARRFSRGENTFATFWTPTAVALTVALALVLYIGGYARYAAAYYQQMHIQEQIRQVTIENDALRAEIDRQRGRDSVATWASTNKMVRTTTPSAIVCGMASTEGR